VGRPPSKSRGGCDPNIGVIRHGPFQRWPWHDRHDCYGRQAFEVAHIRRSIVVDGRVNSFAPSDCPHGPTNLSGVDDCRRGAVCHKEVDVELNRNQYFFLGILVLLLGVQVRNVSAYVLTEEATRFLAERIGSSDSDGALVSFTSDLGAGPKQVLNPPEWLGWCLMSVGAVLILHSLAMKRPGG
jgi:hypothetical protein